MSKNTPMMKQYLEIKAQHKDAFLFFRLGDFYEMFFDDAIQAAQELEITLTKRDSSQKDSIPMCGVPHHSAERYIKTLVDKGYRVAICEQVEDPKKAVGVVKREVIQVITPGTVMEQSMLKENESNYIASISQFSDGSFVVAYNDLSTGENKLILIEDGWETVIHELYNQSIKEVVVASHFSEHLQQDLKQKLAITLSYEDEVTFNAEFRSLCDNITDERLMEAYSRLLNYILHTQKRSLDHLKPAEVIERNNYLSLDMYSKRNLELTESIRKQSKQGTLLSVLDETVTAMGSRLIKQWIERPLLNKTHILNRLQAVEGFYNEFMARETLRELLKAVYDLERLAGRIAFGNVNARDLIQLKQSLQNIPSIKSNLAEYNNEMINRLNEQLVFPRELVDLLETSIHDEPPISITEGNIIKTGYNEMLDEYRDAAINGKQWIAQLESDEKEATGIRSLKVGFNRVFGYYIEITKANLHLIPEGRYERKQTLTNAERFITEELKDKETLILEAEEKSIDLEHELFLDIRDKIKDDIPHLQAIAYTISKIDSLQSFATVSETNNYTKPTFVDDELHVIGGRHPVVEQVMQDGNFVPNDILLNEEKRMLLITGPNMAGKSTYMRQLALTAVMGQIGCFVPCEKADLLIFDQIFTRIGAADDLVAGQSTFMVEMLEAKHALVHATENSLILLDEVGRGTSTYDGMALAQAIIEYIHNHIHAKTLFSTHYHELTVLEDSLDHLKNIHVRAEEYDDKIVFLHQIEEGSADESYGIHVAQLAELPEELIERASHILTKLENKQDVKSDHSSGNEQNGQLTFFVEESPASSRPKEQSKVTEKLKRMNVLEMTPIEALNVLYDLKKQVDKD